MSTDRDQRFAEAIDAVLADEFLTRNVTRVVLNLVDAEASQVLRDAVRDMDRDLASLPHEGRHTRVRWARNWLVSRINGGTS